jgi:hypothetical protein
MHYFQLDFNIDNFLDNFLRDLPKFYRYRYRVK